MLATDLLSNIIIPLSLDQTGEEALAEMQRCKVSHLPVVDAELFQGIIAEQEILDIPDKQQTMQQYKKLTAPFISEVQTVFDVLDVFGKSEVSTLPVLTEQQEYIGAITARSLVSSMFHMLGLALPGSTLILEINAADYVVSEITRIVEMNDARLVSLFVVPSNTGTLDIILRIGQVDVSNVIQSFERYNYKVKLYQMGENKLDDLCADRFNLLMRYMNT